MSEQTNTNNEPKKVSLFREKSLEAIESPESLNDYLKVTSPGVWLVLAAVVTLLVGAILWGIFGHIRTTSQVAVNEEGGKAFCYVPYTQADGILKQGVVSLDDLAGGGGGQRRNGRVLCSLFLRGRSDGPGGRFRGRDGVLPGHGRAV